MKKYFVQLFTLAAVFLFIVRGQDTVSYGISAIKLCAEVLIPSLFPFFVCSGLLIYSGFCESLSRLFAPVMRPLFGINPSGSAAFVLGIVSGYPLGAVTACDLYCSGYLSKKEAERLMAFCNNSGPLYIIGSVGVGLFGGVKAGLLLYAAHILGALSVGILYGRFSGSVYSPPVGNVGVEKMGFGESFSLSMERAIRSMLTVCGAVLFFGILGRLVLDYVPVSSISPFLYGAVEIVTGTVMASVWELGADGRLIAAAVITGFAGLSVHVQVMSVVSKHGLSLKPYILGKLLHAVFSAMYTAVLVRIFASELAAETGRMTLGGASCLGALILFSAAVFIVLISLCARLVHKLSTRKKLRSA